MISRMDKYNVNGETSRVLKNKEVYSSIDMQELSRIKTNNNVSIISEEPKQVDINKIKKYLNSLEDPIIHRERKILFEEPAKTKPKEIIVQEKDYDINSVLEKAREKREIDYESEKYKKINEKQYDILKNINIKEEDSITSIDDLNTEEKTIVDLIKNISHPDKNEELFSDLIGDMDKTIVTSPIKEEKSTIDELDDISKTLHEMVKPLEELTEKLNVEKQEIDNELKEEPVIEKIEIDSTNKINKIDKSFYTNSLSFSKNDFEELDEDNSKGNTFTKVCIVITIVALICTIVFILNYILDLNWF